MKKGTKWGFIDIKGALVIPNDFDRVSGFEGNYAIVWIDKQFKLQYGYIDEHGVWVYEGRRSTVMKEEAASREKAITSAAKENSARGTGGTPITEGYGIIDRKGDFITKQLVEQLLPFSEGLASFRSEARWGYMDTTGTVVIEPSYQFTRPFSEGFAAVQPSPLENDPRTSKYVMIDEQGRTIGSQLYDYGHLFSEGLAPVCIDEMWGFADTSGVLAIPARYYNALSFSEGLAPVLVTGKWGFIDHAGKLRIPAEYDQARSFSEGVAAVKQNERWFFIDKTGQPVSTQRYDDVTDYKDGLAGVKIAPKFRYRDKKGNITLLGATEDTGKWGFIDSSGEFVIDPAFQYLSPFTGGLARGMIDNTQVIIARNGAILWPLEKRGAQK